MCYEYFSKIVETSDIKEVNKLCSDGWLLIGKTENKNQSDKETAFIYSFGKKSSFNDLLNDEED